MAEAWSSSEEESEEEEDLAMLALTAMFVGLEETRRNRAERRLPNRRYLCRAQLLPDPRHNTPWQVLYESRSDRAFITTMGIDCSTFDAILRAGFSQHWNTQAIPRSDANPYGNPRLGRRSLTAEGALGLAYHYLTSAMSDTSLQQIFALTPSTVSRYRQFSLSILLQTLKSMPDAEINWWQTDEECDADNALVLARHPALIGAIGSIDGVNLPAAVSEDPNIENATYNGWLHGHFVSCVLVFSPRGMCLDPSISHEPRL